MQQGGKCVIFPHDKRDTLHSDVTYVDLHRAGRCFDAVKTASLLLVAGVGSQSVGVAVTAIAAAAAAGSKAAA